MSGESESEESYASAEESELSDGAEEHCGLTLHVHGEYVKIENEFVYSGGIHGQK